MTVAGAGFVTALVESEAVKLMNTIDSTFGGPMIGLFTCGVFLPWTNRKGGLIGFVCGVLFNLWVVLGQMVYGRTPGRDPVFPVSIAECPDHILTNLNQTTAAVTQAATEAATTLADRPAIADTFYQVSYLYVGCQGFVFTVIVSLIVSFITGHRRPEESDPAFFMPLIDLRILPDRVNSFFRFGVPPYLQHNSDYYIESSACKRDKLREALSSRDEEEEKEETARMTKM